MPTYSYNVSAFLGDHETIAELNRVLKFTSRSCDDYNLIVPMPQEVATGDAEIRYDWIFDNWSTPRGFDIEKSITKFGEFSTLVWKIDTKWCAPFKIYDLIFEKFPDLRGIHRSRNEMDNNETLIMRRDPRRGFQHCLIANLLRVEVENEGLNEMVIPVAGDDDHVMGRNDPPDDPEPEVSHQSIELSVEQELDEFDDAVLCSEDTIEPPFDDFLNGPDEDYFLENCTIEVNDDYLEALASDAQLRILSKLVGISLAGIEARRNQVILHR